MAKYDVTYKCGHVGTVELFGKSADREWKLAKMAEENCPDCAAEHAAQHRAEFNSENQMAELTGSEKQIAWADKIRYAKFSELQEIIAKKNAMAQNYAESGKISAADAEKVVNQNNAILNYLENQESAKFWIDNRDLTAYSFAELAVKAIAEMPTVEPATETTESDEAADKAAAEAEAIVTPVEKTESTIPAITCTENAVMVKSEKNENLRQILKKHDFDYDYQKFCWVKKITETTGSAEERAAEIGNAALQNGFAICVYDEKIRQRAINADFTPECTNWVRVRNSEKFKNTKYYGWFSIKWQGKNDVLYNAAKRISESRWDCGAMVVPIRQYREILDFAETMRFQITASAQNAISAFIEHEQKPVTPVMPTANGGNDITKILESSREVLDDLRDSD
jgi:hypothetical protein